MRRAVLIAALSLPFFAECAGEKQQEPPAEPEVPPAPPPPPPQDAGPSDAAADAPDGSAEAEAQLAALTEEALTRFSPDAPAPHGLRFNVVERGPDQPWLLAVANDGSEPVELAADPRLVTLEVVVPQKKRKRVNCRLPAAERPDEPDDKYVVHLEPGQAAIHVFDPRLYCFGAAGQDQLVPGAFVEPRLGWAPKVKKRRIKGKLEETPVEPQSPPFVALIGGQDAGASSKPGIKELRAPGFGLSSDYQKWSRYGLKRPDDVESPFILEARRGSDAQTDRGATLTVTLKNRSKKARQIFFRRELVSYEVMGPDGIMTCDAQPDDRAPPKEGYRRLGPGQSITSTSRLIELCPDGTFAKPGLYLLHARFDATRSGEEWGLKAFVGQAVTQEPATVRIRKGEMPLFTSRPMRVVEVPKTARESKSSAK
jgi:hypothetical protein